MITIRLGEEKELNERGRSENEILRWRIERGKGRLWRNCDKKRMKTRGL